jgi:peptide/nickel transport system permease protein
MSAGAPPPSALEPVEDLSLKVGPPRDDATMARRERVRVLLHSKSFIAGAIIVGFFVFCAIFGRLIVLQDPFDSDPLNQLQSPDANYWFGTDRLGRDVFSRVIVGARDIMLIAPAATLLGTILGTALGLITGYFRGAVDDVLSRIIEAVLALPVVLVGILALTSLGPSNVTIILVVGFVFAPVIARTVRAAVLSERELEYVSAARLRNEKTPYILFAEILPNVMGPVVVEFTVRLGYAIFVVATLSFLGLGVQPPSPDWGLQVFEHYGLISGGFWWPVLFPAAAIAILVIGVNLIADGLTQAFER